MKREEKTLLAREIGAGGMVLLRNNNSTLPLKKDSEVALFGIASYRCMRMGSGSGDMLAHNPVEISEGLINSGYSLEKEVYSYSKKWVEEHSDEYFLHNRNWAEWKFRFNEIQYGSIIRETSSKCDTAIITIGRSEGEAQDLRDEAGSFRLHSDEIALIKCVSENYKHTVLLLNIGGVLDLTAIDNCNVDSVLDVSLCGEQFGNSVADVLSGKVSPSGKLAQTWAYQYNDFPTKDELFSLYIPYNEGIYVGYRYFDSFGITPRYPFGYGLSYTDFNIGTDSIVIDEPIVDIQIRITNEGETAGREVVQCYISCPNGKLIKPYQDLCAFTKTEIIQPKETVKTSLSFDLTDFASYDENRAEFILEAGEYIIRVGNSSRNTHVAGVITVASEIICEKVTNRLVCNEKLNLIAPLTKGYTYCGETKEISEAKRIAFEPSKVITYESKGNLKAYAFNNASKSGIKIDDVYNNKETVENFISQFSNDDLAHLLNGAIYEGANANANVGSMSLKVHGAAGETWTSEKYGLTANTCADGPSGVRLVIFGEKFGEETELAKEMVSFPCGTCLANSWDVNSARKFGEAIQSDLEISNIEGWLAPGLNIQRNPLNGRNFEYFSEDPLIAGKMSANISVGVQTDENGELTGRYVTIKHFACNNVEYERGLSDSRVSERALREIYLKGYRIAIDEGSPLALMTSYNKLNGEFSSTNYDLLNGILRDEWGFKGMVMTDWNPASDPTRHSYAGNDLLMPGVHYKELLEGLNSGKINKQDAQNCAARIIELLLKTNLVLKYKKS